MISSILEKSRCLTNFWEILSDSIFSSLTQWLIFFKQSKSKRDVSHKINFVSSLLPTMPFFLISNCSFKQLFIYKNTSFKALSFHDSLRGQTLKIQNLARVTHNLLLNFTCWREGLRVWRKQCYFLCFQFIKIKTVFVVPKICWYLWIQLCQTSELSPQATSEIFCKNHTRKGSRETIWPLKSRS